MRVEDIFIHVNYLVNRGLVESINIAASVCVHDQVGIITS